MKFQLETPEQFITIPGNINDITFHQFIELQADLRRLYSVNRDENLSEDEKAIKGKDCIDSFLSHVVIFEGIKPDKLVFGPIFGPDFKFTQLFSGEITTMDIFSHIYNVIQSYQINELKPDFEITHKGQKYVLDQNKAFTHISGKGYTNGEVFTVLQFQKIAREEMEKSQDVDGNIAFNLGLRELAVILRPEGHEMPSATTDIENYINKMAPVMAELPAGIAMDCRFFLKNMLRRAGKTPLQLTFGNRRSLNRVKRKKNARRGQRRGLKVRKRLM